MKRNTDTESKLIRKELQNCVCICIYDRIYSRTTLVFLYLRPIAIVVDTKCTACANCKQRLFAFSCIIRAVQNSEVFVRIWVPFVANFPACHNICKQQALLEDKAFSSAIFGHAMHILGHLQVVPAFLWP